MWKQVLDNIWVPKSSSNTVTIKTVFNLFKVLETIDRIDCNERNLLKALNNRLIPICAVLKFITNLRWLSSISFKGWICHGSWGWTFFWDNLFINTVQTNDENHYAISTHVGLFQCNRQDNIHSYDTETRQGTGYLSRTLDGLRQLEALATSQRHLPGSPCRFMFLGLWSGFFFVKHVTYCNHTAMVVWEVILDKKSVIVSQDWLLACYLSYYNIYDCTDTSCDQRVYYWEEDFSMVPAEEEKGMSPWKGFIRSWVTHLMLLSRQTVQK